MNILRSEVLFNRALFWLVMMYLTESKVAAMLFAINVVLNLLWSFIEWSSYGMGQE